MRRVAIAAMVASVVLCSWARAENLLRNGGFEDWSRTDPTHNARPAHWTVFGGWFGKYQLPGSGHNVPDNDEGRRDPAEGEHAWELSHLEVGDEHGGCQTVHLWTGEYRLSGLVRATSNRDGQEIFVEVAPEDGEPTRRYLRHIPGASPDYVAFSQDFTISGGYCRVSLGIRRHADRGEGHSPYTHWDEIVLECLSLSEKAELPRDSDYDGWLDRLERRYGTNPQRPDTDGDGVEDSRDDAPLSPDPMDTNFLAGETEGYDGRLPMTFMWCNIALNEEDGGKSTLEKLAEWGIGPALGMGASRNGEPRAVNPHLQELIDRGVQVTGWMCCHPHRKLNGYYGLNREQWDMADPVTRQYMARLVGLTAKSNPHISHLSPVDEITWNPARPRPELFAGWLSARGYNPHDFVNAATSWEDVPMLDMTRPPPDDPRLRLLRREWQLFGEQVTLEFFQAIATRMRAVRPDLGVNIGIFSPWSLHFGAYSSLPMTRFWQVEEADFFEFDWYDWIYTGNWVADEDFPVVEAAHQFTCDLLRKPLQLTFAMNFTAEGDARDETYYRLLPLCSLLQTGNVTGMTFFYYGMPVGDGGERARIDHPRVQWLGRSISRAREAYEAVHRYKEIQPILIVTRDPLDMGEGSRYDEEGNRREFRPFADRLVYGTNFYGDAFKRISQVQRDARFCVPRMLPGLDLSGYGVIILEAERIGDLPRRRLLQWAADGGLLLISAGAATEDDLALPRADVAELRSAPGVQPLPRDLRKLREVLEAHIDDPWYRPMGFSPMVDVDVHVGPGDRRIVVVANYARRPRSFSFALPGVRVDAKPMFGTAVDVTHRHSDGELLVRGTMSPREVEVLRFR